VSDPMSGFFALPRDLFEEVAPRLTGTGFKI
jgi:dolichol-phosphate mannosyltransferase